VPSLRVLLLLPLSRYNLDYYTVPLACLRSICDVSPTVPGIPLYFQNFRQRKERYAPPHTCPSFRCVAETHSRHTFFRKSVFASASRILVLGLCFSAPASWLLASGSSNRRAGGKPTPCVPGLARMSQLTPLVSTLREEAARWFCETPRIKGSLCTRNQPSVKEMHAVPRLPAIQWHLQDMFCCRACHFSEWPSSPHQIRPLRQGPLH